MWGWTAPRKGVPAEQLQFLSKGHLRAHTPLHIRAPGKWKSKATAHQVCTALQHSADDYAFKDTRSEQVCCLSGSAQAYVSQRRAAKHAAQSNQACTSTGKHSE